MASSEKLSKSRWKESTDVESAIFTDAVGELVSNQQELAKWWSRVEETSSITIEKSLSHDGWRSLMGILQNRDVSKIKHLILPMDFTIRSDADLEDLANLLKTGRFLELQSLLLQTDQHLTPTTHRPGHQLVSSPARTTPRSSKDSKVPGFGPGTLFLGKALSRGNLHKLRNLSLSMCNVIPIMEEIMQSSFQLRSMRLGFNGETNSYNRTPGLNKRALLPRSEGWNVGGNNDYADCLRQLPRVLQKVFESGRFKWLGSLELTHGAFSGEFASLEAFATAMRSGQLAALKFLRLSGNHSSRPRSFRLADLAVSNSFRTLESLQVDDCRVASEQVVELVNDITENGEVLPLQRLHLQHNDLGNEGIDAMVKLAKSGLTPHLRELALRDTTSVSPRMAPVHTSFTNLVMAIREGHFPRLQTLDWRANSVSDEGVNAISSAYTENKAVTVRFLIDKDSVRDSSLLLMASEARETNVGLTKSRDKLNGSPKGISSGKAVANTAEEDPVNKVKSLADELGLTKHMTLKFDKRGKSENTISLMQDLTTAPTRAYKAQMRDVVRMGLLPEDVNVRDSRDPDSWSHKPADLFTAAPCLESEGVEITKSFLIKQIWNVIESVKAIHGEVALNRQLQEDMRKEINVKFSEARQEQNLLLRRVQALQSFDLEEKDRSVPRYVFLSQGERSEHRRVWISLKEAFRTVSRMHFLCEARYDDGLLHEVADQEGIQIRNPREWLQKISPWLEWSLKIAIVVAKNAGGTAVPGLAMFIPDYQSSDVDSLAKSVRIASTVFNEQSDNERGGRGGPKSPINVKEKLIAEAVIGDIMKEIGQAVFVQKIGLRKVLLNQTVFLHGQASSSSRTKCSVAWICEPCWKNYRKQSKATDITPRT